MVISAMGRNLEIAEDLLIAVNKNGNLPEKRKKDKKFEECDQSRRFGKNESHSNEFAKTVEYFRGTKEKSTKRKLAEVELSADQIPESNGKHLDTDENKEIKAEQKRKKGNKSSFSGELDLESLEKKDDSKRKEEEKIREVREEFGVNGVFVTGNNVKYSKYKTLGSFAESGLPAEVLNCCKTFSKPSPIQAHAWPFLLDGRDFIGIAATGSGKTLAFGVPALMHVLAKDNKKKFTKAVPRCLVLSPTRELAQQIADVLQDAGSACGITTVCVYGGTSKGPQISLLKTGVDIVIGTPGRLKDLIEMGVCSLKDVSFVVLDEADRMLDMGFEPEVRAILSKTASGLAYSFHQLLALCNSFNKMESI